MHVSKAEYTVKKAFAQRNLENIKAFLPTALQRLKPGSSYTVAISKDGLSFMHLFVHETEEELKMLGEIPAFLQFLKEVMENCEAPPSMTSFTQI